jgi:hypothetical protein
MEMIKNFTDFLNESKDHDFKVADLFATLTRNYETKKNFDTDLLQFIVEEERRDWGDLRAKAELEDTKTDEGFYKLVFIIDEKRYLLEIKMDISYRGKLEKDAPETASDEDLNRLNLVLENIEVKKISLKATDLDYVTSSPSDSVLSACKKFLVKMLEVDYDTQGNKIYSLEQK